MTEHEIFSGMLETFRQETGYEMNVNTDLAVRFRAAAAQIMGLYGYGDYVFRQAFPQTAEGENLDRHGELRGVERVAGANAQGTLTFGASGIMETDLTVPQGTVCVSSTGAAFETTEAGVLYAGELSVTVAAQAVEAGSQGNVDADTVRTMQSPPDGIGTVTNEAPFSGGRDPEEDESYRARILGSYMGLSNGANMAYYSQIALSVPGVDRVKVVPCVNGAGTVGVFVASDGGIVTEETLELLEERFSQRRELGITVTVSVPEAVSVDIAAKIMPAEGNTLATAKNMVEKALQTCFAGDRMGKTLYLAQLGHSAMSTGAIENITFSAPAEDVTVEAGQQAVLGTLTLEGM